MNAKELAAIQAPFKEKYRDYPEAAMLTLHAEGKLTEELGCDVQIGEAQIGAGLHPAAGGKEGTISPVTLLLASLATCFGVTLRAVSTFMGLDIRNGTILAEGDLDLRGTLGVVETVPVGLQKIRMDLTLDTDESEERIKTLIELVEKYAVVFRTLVPALEVIISWRKGRTRH